MTSELIEVSVSAKGGQAKRCPPYGQKEHVVAVGIPAKKATFRFAQKFDGVVSAALGNDHLYVQYGTAAGKRYFKDFDLQHYSGDEESEPAQLGQEVEVRWRPMFLHGNLLHVYGEQPELIDVSQWERIYSEYEGTANPDWSIDGRFVYHGKQIYRAFGWNDYTQGLDIVRDSKVIGHADIDIQYFMPCTDGLIYGVRLSSPTFCVYSIIENTVKLEVPLAHYEFAYDEPTASVSRCGDRLHVLAGNHVLIIDLATFSVVAEFAYFNTDFMQTLLSGLKYKNAAISHFISASGSTLVLSGAKYLLCLSTADGSVLWGRENNYDMLAANTDGDLVFGLEERRPRAWDKYTGDEVWQASAGTIANSIDVCGNWLVFYQPAGDIQCFTWKKPYTSPHRPN
ncbi:hypothetical protein [Aquipseudomonas ullengensis]|uniref:Uncharacterized protein n=1 Tax=Aquipseudomonas ullengensis TaxID=2759166 RepID=A0A7W4LQH8_9GAMM|nr:hypothetical protein [Pseudomonas ullengensis]MBB2497456.1 hypothetical protein [Pseudomonas ullengensis]